MWVGGNLSDEKRGERGEVRPPQDEMEVHQRKG